MFIMLYGFPVLSGCNNEAIPIAHSQTAALRQKDWLYESFVGVLAAILNIVNKYIVPDDFKNNSVTIVE
jgi:hypothetical protein